MLKNLLDRLHPGARDAVSKQQLTSLVTVLGMLMPSAKAETRVAIEQAISYAAGLLEMPGFVETDSKAKEELVSFVSSAYVGFCEQAVRDEWNSEIDVTPLTRKQYYEVLQTAVEGGVRLSELDNSN